MARSSVFVQRRWPEPSSNTISDLESAGGQNSGNRSSTGAVLIVAFRPPVITGHIVVTLRAIEIVRKTVLTAPTAFAPFVGLLSGFDLLQSFLDQTVFSSFLCQLFAAPFILAGRSLAVSTRRLFGGDMKFVSAHTAGSF
jgi:hypothetical protein